MELQDLNEDERVALAGLIVQMIDGLAEGSAGSRSPEEMQEFLEIAEEMGRADFDAAIAEARKRGAGDRKVALALAAAVERPQVRELVHTVLVDLAASDFLSDEERELIRTVAGMWGISTRV